MYKIASADLGINEAILEKDCFIVLMLKILFSHDRFKKLFAFKGGTSLSRVFNKIQRFSEDIDLILDWQILGYSKNEPWDERSKTGQIKFNNEANERAANWIRLVLVPELNKTLIEMSIEKVKLKVSSIDSQTVQIQYPNGFKDNSILQEIRLEIGPLAAWTPVKNYPISAYIVEEFPQIFNDKLVIVPTVEAKRTFWEKVTIMHKEANRTKTLTPARYSRHYYDIYQLSQSTIKDEALNDVVLLKEVVSFKNKFYADNSAKYNEAIPGKIKLMPNEMQIEGLSKDYDVMKNMMFNEYPSFQEILVELHRLENQINKLI